MLKNIVNLGTRLLIFTLVAALLLAGTNMITRGPIAEQKQIAAQAAQRAVLPTAENFVEKTPADYAADAAETYPLIQKVYEGTAASGSAGYVLTAAPQGYGGPIPITLGIGADGSIHGVQVGDLKETAGLGMRVGEQPFLSQYDALAADPKVIDDKIDTISGVTVSSKPFKEATKQMTAFAVDVLGIEPNPGTPVLAGEDLLRKEQLPDATSFEALNALAVLGDYGDIQSITAGKVGDTIVGYTFDLASKGFVDLIHSRVSIDAEGNVGTLVLGEQQESEGYGARLGTQEGTDFATRFAGQPATKEGIDAIDGLSGATVSSSAVKQGVKQAGAFYQAYLIPKPDPDAGVEFADIVLPTPDDYKAVQSAQAGSKDGAVVKYRFVVKVTGYHEETPMLLQIDVDAAGNYLAMIPIEQHETEGIGANVFTNADFLAQIGGATATVETADGVQAVSGATVTSDAIKRGLKQVARAYQSIAASAPAAGDAGAATAAAPSFPVVEGVFTGASFEPVAFTDTDKKFPTVKAIDKATQGGALVGYRIVTVSTGYNEAEKITLQTEIDAAGTLVDVQVLAQNETAGIGADLLTDAAFVSQVNGTPAVGAFESVQVKSGATVTSEAFIKGIKHAGLAYDAVKEVP